MLSYAQVFKNPCQRQLNKEVVSRFAPTPDFAQRSSSKVSFPAFGLTSFILHGSTIAVTAKLWFLRATSYLSRRGIYETAKSQILLFLHDGGVISKFSA